MIELKPFTHKGLNDFGVWFLISFYTLIYLYLPILPTILKKINNI